MTRILSRAAMLAIVLSSVAAPVFAHEGHSHHNETTAQAETVEVGELEISGAFTRATLPNQPVGGGYLTITNNGNVDDRLIGGTASFAGEVQVHEMAVVNDVMNMRQLEDGLVIPAGESVALEPGGYHLMFMALSEPLSAGDTVTVTLEFEKAGPVEVDFAIVTPGARPSQGHQHSEHSADDEGAPDGEHEHSHHDH